MPVFILYFKISDSSCYIWFCSKKSPFSAIILLNSLFVHFDRMIQKIRFPDQNATKSVSPYLTFFVTMKQKLRLNYLFLRFGPPIRNTFLGADKYDWSFADETFNDSTHFLKEKARQSPRFSVFAV